MCLAGVIAENLNSNGRVHLWKRSGIGPRGTPVQQQSLSIFNVRITARVTLPRRLNYRELGIGSLMDNHDRDH